MIFACVWLCLFEIKIQESINNGCIQTSSFPVKFCFQKCLLYSDLPRNARLPHSHDLELKFYGSGIFYAGVNVSCTCFPYRIVYIFYIDILYNSVSYHLSTMTYFYMLCVLHVLPEDDRILMAKHIGLTFVYEILQYF